MDFEKRLSEERFLSLVGRIRESKKWTNRPTKTAAFSEPFPYRLFHTKTVNTNSYSTTLYTGKIDNRTIEIIA